MIHFTFFKSTNDQSNREYYHVHNNGLMQNCGNSIANALLTQMHESTSIANTVEMA